MTGDEEANHGPDADVIQQVVAAKFGEMELTSETMHVTVMREDESGSKRQGEGFMDAF